MNLEVGVRVGLATPRAQSGVELKPRRITMSLSAKKAQYASVTCNDHNLRRPEAQVDECVRTAALWPQTQLGSECLVWGCEAQYVSVMACGSLVPVECAQEDRYADTG